MVRFICRRFGIKVPKKKDIREEANALAKEPNASKVASEIVEQIITFKSPQDFTVEEKEKSAEQIFIGLEALDYAQVSQD